MLWAWPEGFQSLLVQLRRIPLVHGEVISGKTRIQVDHHAIAHHLGDDRGRTDAGTHGVCLPHADIATVQPVDGKTVTDDVTRPNCKTIAGSSQPLDVGLLHPQSIALGCGDHCPGHGSRPVSDLIEEPITCLGGEPLGIRESKNTALGRVVKDHGSCHQGASAGTTTGLIATSHWPQTGASEQTLVPAYPSTDSPAASSRYWGTRARASAHSRRSGASGWLR